MQTTSLAKGLDSTHGKYTTIAMGCSDFTWPPPSSLHIGWKIRLGFFEEIENATYFAIITQNRPFYLATVLKYFRKQTCATLKNRTSI